MTAAAFVTEAMRLAMAFGNTRSLHAYKLASAADLQRSESAFRTHLEAREAQHKRLADALVALLRVFPTDFDLLEAGWETAQVNHACDAHERAVAVYKESQA